jgi:hypothetical protein
MYKHLRNKVNNLKKNDKFYSYLEKQMQIIQAILEVNTPFHNQSTEGAEFGWVSECQKGVRRL